MSRYYLHFPLALVVALPGMAAAQMNAPLTGAATSPPAAVAAPVAPAMQAMPDRPVVRQMSTPMPAAAPAASASAPVAATPVQVPAAEHYEDVGDVTRGLLAAQADGRRAGGALPILGAVSTASWNRYLESFRQPIPQWFTEKVKTGSK